MSSFDPHLFYSRKSRKSKNGQIIQKTINAKYSQALPPKSTELSKELLDDQYWLVSKKIWQPFTFYLDFPIAYRYYKDLNTMMHYNQLNLDMAKIEFTDLWYQRPGFIDYYSKCLSIINMKAELQSCSTNISLIFLYHDVVNSTLSIAPTDTYIDTYLDPVSTFTETEPQPLIWPWRGNAILLDGSHFFLEYLPTSDTQYTYRSGAVAYENFPATLETKPDWTRSTLFKPNTPSTRGATDLVHFAYSADSAQPGSQDPNEYLRDLRFYPTLSGPSFWNPIIIGVNPSSSQEISTRVVVYVNVQVRSRFLVTPWRWE